MKKYLPFVFPLVALLLVVFIGMRWYNDQTNTKGEISKFGEGVEIENLTGNGTNNPLLRNTTNYKTVELQGEGERAGQVRYEIVDGKIRFTVMAYLPDLTEGQYEVWLKDPNSESMRKAFALTLDKGGYTGSAAISTDTLPFEVIVSQETRPDNTIEMILLRGTINKE